MTCIRSNHVAIIAIQQTYCSDPIINNNYCLALCLLGVLWTLIHTVIIVIPLLTILFSSVPVRGTVDPYTYSNHSDSIINNSVQLCAC